MGHDIKDLPELDFATPAPPQPVRAPEREDRDYGYAGIVPIDDVENA
jgi:hypothetical protein